MHAFFAPFGSMPNNAIVGGSADIATGAALFKRINRKGGIVVANIGDATMGCGPVWEAKSLAAMDQYRSLWPKELGGSPPILFNFFNNFYGMGGQTDGETMGYKILARGGAGVNPDNMHSERVDGYNPLAVADAVARKRAILLEGRGPVLLDTITYRVSGHSPSDAGSYRTKEEVEAWQKADAIEGYAAYLADNNTRYTEELCRWALETGARFIYASSAATYGDGSLGFSDDIDGVERLQPLNMYAYSKQLFDRWAIALRVNRKQVFTEASSRCSGVHASPGPPNSSGGAVGRSGRPVADAAA
jgi:hypothetical protein